MSLADAFAGMKPKHSGAQAPKALRAAAPRHSGTQVLGGLGSRAPKRLRAEAPAPLSLQGTAKSKHPEFEPVKVYLRQATHKAARRKFEDAGEGDFSDLVQQLLEKYVRGER